MTGDDGRDPPLRRAKAGLAAGAVASLAMSGAMAGARASGLLGTPPPRRITSRLARRAGLRRTPLRERGLRLASGANHLAFGAGMGAAYALAERGLRGHWAPVGAAWGIGVWACSYGIVLPRLGLHPAPWEDRPGRTTAMVAAHIVYGLTLAALLPRPGGRQAPA